MAEETIVSWNAANWITIILMVAIGFTVLGFIARMVQAKNAA
jgi:hypothetical protein